MCILLTGATWYYHAIYIVFTYFASFTGYKYDIFEVIFNLSVQWSKFGGKSFYQLCGVHGVCFFFQKAKGVLQTTLFDLVSILE